MKLSLPGFGFAVLAGLSISQGASADVIIGNLPQSNDTGFTTFSSSFRTVKALSFVMNAGADYTVDSVVLRLLNFSSDDSLVVTIRDDGGTNPGATVLGTFTAPNPLGNGTTANYTFALPSSLTLTAGTKYWLDVAWVAGDFTWRVSQPSITPTGVAATYGGNSRISINGGAFTTSGNINSFQINGTQVVSAVPEPSTLALLLLAAPAGALTLRRRPRRA